jgi:peptidoglycan/xylan/chitin deacetylase (PgdA/CDA1 family)
MRLGVVAVVALLVLLLNAGPAAPRTNIASSAAASGQTTVSLTFDDGTATQYAARSLLASHGMKATFYVNTSKLGTADYYMTWAQVHDLAADGNEIAGHTGFHVDLPQTDPVEAQREICNDRVNLLNQGFQATDFAYPYGTYNASVESMVQNCGYNSARSTSQFVPPPAETIPPQDPYAIRVAGSGGSLATLESYVTRVEQNGGGWAPLIFHEICDGCSISQSDLTSFLSWLQPRAANGTVVKTVQQVIGGAVQPAVQGPTAPPPPNGTSALRNASLEQDSDANKAPDCWDFDSYGNNSFIWSRTSDAHSGSYAERVDVSHYVDGDSKLVVTRDFGFCTPSVTPGHRYRITTWYKSSAPVHYTVFTRDSLGGFYYWKSSPDFSASSTWTQASFVTDAIPTGVNGLSFGLTLASDGSMTVDDLSFDDAAASGGADTTPPTVSLTAPSANSTVSGFVPISANASDNVAVDHVDYLIDGAVAATLTSGPFTYNWNSRSVSNGSHTIAVRAVDTAGNQRTTTPISVFVSNQTASLLQNPSLEQGTSNPPSCWLLGGYGTNTFTWTWTADAHTGTHAENLNISAYTNGDRKLLTAFSSTCSPAVTPGHTYTITAWYKSTAKPVFMAFSNTTGGNGAYSYFGQSPQQAVAAGWTQTSWATPVIPAGVTNLSVGMGLVGQAGSVTMDDFSMTDNAPLPDTTPPASMIACNGGGAENGCASGFYNGPVEIDLSATDDPGGSGVARVIYTLDGTTPSATNGTTYNGPFSVGQTTTVKSLAIDKAGNVETTIQSQLIQIDMLAPSATIACNSSPCGSGAFTNTVSVTMNGTDTGGAGVDRIVYTTDGSTPTPSSGNDYIGAFSVNTNMTIKFIAIDKAGNAGTVGTQSLQVDALPPSTTISCNSSPCNASPYSAGVIVALSASDGSGSGVASIRYTTDGSDPTASSGTVYLAPFTVAATATVKYRAFDNAGNAEAIKTQLVTVDTTAPTVSLTAPSDGASVNGSVPMSANASDNVAVDHVDFLVDGSTLAGSDSSSPYGISWGSSSVPDGTHTVVAKAFDTAGNSTTSGSVSITVGNAVDTTAPTSTISCDGAACSSSPYSPGPVSVTLAATDNVGGSGLDKIVYTTDGSDPSVSNGTDYTGAFSLASTTTVKYRAYDLAGNAEATNSQLITISVPGDTTAPTSTISCDGASCAPSAYPLPVSATLAASDDPGGSGVAAIRYTTDGSDPSVTNGTIYSAPFTVSATTTVKYRAIDSAGNIEAINSQLITIGAATPSVTLTAPQDGDILNGTSVSFNATVTALSPDHVDFFVGANKVGTATSAPWSISWDSTSVPDGPYTVSAQAVDGGGGTTNSNTASVTVKNTQPPPPDLTPPDTTISCNAAPCGSGYFNAAVTITLAASDNPGGSGVDRIVYTTDGSTPTLTHGTVYAGAFSVSTSPTTVKYRAFDNAGNAEATSSLLIRLDTVAPSSSIQCNGTACAGSFYSAAVSATLSANDVGGSGVDKIVYTTDGSDPTATNGTVYSGAFGIGSTTTVKYRAFDVAGNAEPVNSALLQVDTVAPTTTINCAGSPCNAGGWYKSGVSISLVASDGSGSSGVAQIRYTTNGTIPTKTTGTVYTAPFTLSATTTVNYRAYDNVGNLENNNAIQIQIDPTAPTVSLTAPSAGATVSGSTNLSANASDNIAVDHVDFLVDGSVVGTVASSPYTFSWNSGSVPDGNHTVAARASDSAGNQTTTSNVTVTVTNQNLLQNAGLESGSGNTPTCWALGGYGANTFVWTWTSDAHTGTHAENLNITAYTNGDRKLLTAFNGSCSIATQAGRQYTISVWYKSTARPAIFAFTSTTGPTGGYNFLAQSPAQPIASGWTQASWTTPAMPAGTTNISVGMGLTGQAGSVTMDDFGAFRTN